jgi:tetratricopeptide (TPR) repeat protein
MNIYLWLLAVASLLGPLPAWAFTHAKIGGVIENIQLTALSGGQYSLLSNATANVFVFVRPGQEHSRTTMIQLAACEKEMAGKSVHWVAVVSDRFQKDEMEAMARETGFAMPILIDVGDALYAKLGVLLCPVLGITDQDHKLVAYEYFTKVNFTDVIRARIRYLLNEISAEDLERVLKPAGTLRGADAEKAQRRLKLAEKLFLAKSYPKALENVNDSIAKDGTAAAYALKGRIHVALGDKEAALGAFSESLKLDPANTNALEGIKAFSK